MLEYRQYVNKGDDMADLRETVTQTKEAGIDDNGAVVEQRTKHIQTNNSAGTRTVLQNVVWYIMGLVEILLGIRFLLKLLGANPASGFVDFIYSVTNVLTAPFDNIFNVARVDAGQVQSVFEPSIIVAMVVYALIAMGIRKLFAINQRS